MILPFSTQLNGKPTYFVERIHSGLLINGLWEGGFDSNFAHHNFSTDALAEKHAKIHTIREDKKDRWMTGTKIDFFINCRQPNMFRFAPVLPVMSIQEVFMTYYSNDIIKISIDGRELFSYIERLEFAHNDGFDNWEDFFNYFYPKIKANKSEFFKGKIIHWTDKRY